MEKVLCLFSGGLDSRLAVKILKEEGLEVEAVYFKLPFTGCSSISEVISFLEEEKISYTIFDCSKGDLLREYLEEGQELILVLIVNYLC
jgi:tRNA U34 2-thiouridine synthase MnmA/TrmU